MRTFAAPPAVRARRRISLRVVFRVLGRHGGARSDTPRLQVPSRALVDRLAAEGAVPSCKQDLAAQPLIGWSSGTGGIAAADWLRDAAPAEAVVYHTSSLINQFAAARAGLGFAVLPCYLGDPEPDLARAWPAPIADLVRELWIVMHRDLKDTARVRAFFDIVGDGLARRRPLFEGERRG
jgi:DNA-binding transcriptional LysR family regulator